MADRSKFRPVSNPPPLPEATLTDVRAVINGLTTGVYLSSVLYARYQEILKEQGREPVHKVVFGRMLGEYGLLKRARKGGSAWLVQE